MKEISLTQGKVAVVDDEDYPLLAALKWSALKSKRTWYARTVVYLNGRAINLQMHRLILRTPRGAQIDHTDHDGLNNCRHNLRSATPSQNCQNRRRRRDSTSGYKGVCLHKRIGKFQAYISQPGRILHLGYFLTPEEAALAYDAKARELFGEFALLNFPGSEVGL